MNTRQVRAWVWWLLPFLVARALMPVGFMAQAQAGQLNVVLCSAGFAKLQSPAESTQTSTSPGKLQHQDNSQANLLCPFAHASGSALAFTPPASVAPKLVSIERSAAVPASIILTRPFNAHRGRGPPLFS